MSPDFKGKSLLEQHKMVNQVRSRGFELSYPKVIGFQALGDEVKKLHGVNIQTIGKE